jgi:MFS family permease
MIPWEEEFGWSRSSISLARGILLASQGLVTPFSGHMVDVFGPRYSVVGGQILLAVCLCLEALMQKEWQLFVLYGGFSGAGYGMLNLNIYAAMVRSFEYA